MRLTDCDGAPPCSLSPTKDNNIEVDFIPRDGGGATIEVIADISSKGNLTPEVGEVGVVTPGHINNLGTTFKYPSAMTGLSGDLRVMLWSDELMVCGRFGFKAV